MLSRNGLSTEEHLLFAAKASCASVVGVIKRNTECVNRRYYLGIGTRVEHKLHSG